MSNTVCAFGEIMLRLSAADGAIATSKSFDACYGGTECNVLACLSRLGHSTRYVTALPSTEIGKAAKAHISSFGIDTRHIVMRGDVMGLYFVESGAGSRGSNVIYMRDHSEFTRLTPDDIDYDGVFDGVTLFHISGISFALSKSSRALAFRLLTEAKARGIKVSFDFNYRAKLWSTEQAAEQFVKAVEYADIVLASSLDLDVFVKQSPEQFMSSNSAEYLILRDRKVLSNDRHSVKLDVYTRGDMFAITAVEFPVTERIGGGDAFNGAMLHAIMSGKPIDEAAKFAVAAFALKHTISGDTFTGDEQAIAAYRNRFSELK